MKSNKMIVAAAAALPLLFAAPALALSEPGPATASSPSASPAASLSSEEVDSIELLLAGGDGAAVSALSNALLVSNHVEIELSRRGDPMTIPFLVSPVVRRTAFGRMNDAHARGDFDEAARIARYLVQEHSGTPEAESAANLLVVLGRKTGGPEKPEAPKPVVLPPWVSLNTSTVLFDAEDPMVGVGTEFYRVGQALRDHPNVVVEAIRSGEVVFRVNEDHASASFVVQVEAEE